MTESAAIVFHLPLIAVLVALLCLSAFFSASEAAYFSISRSALLELEGRTRRERMVPELLRDPRMLLVTILFGHLLVNIAATSVVHNVPLVTRDPKLRASRVVPLLPARG